MKKKPARLRYEIRFDAAGWCFVAPGGELLLIDKNKAYVVDGAAELLGDAWGALRLRSELIIKTKAGKIGKDKRTYGEDPVKVKG